MAFYLYKREERQVEYKIKEWFQQVKQVKLSSFGKAIYNLWLQKEKPLNLGWHININELLHVLTDGMGNSNSDRLVIDFHPTAKSRIALIDVLDIYAYTYGDSKRNKSDWSIIMPRLRDVYIDKLEQKKDFEDIERTNREFSIDKRQDDPALDIYEFLYLHGDYDKQPWNFGRVGQVNAAFIHKPARDYFKNFFCK